MIISFLSYSYRALTKDGVHFTTQDYQHVATEINLHITRHRLSHTIPQTPLEKHEDFLAEMGDLEQGEIRIEVQWDSDISEDDIEVEEEIMVEYIKEELVSGHEDSGEKGVTGDTVREVIGVNTATQGTSSGDIWETDEPMEADRGDVWDDRIDRELYTITEDLGHEDESGDIWGKDSDFSGNLVRTSEPEQACGITTERTPTTDSGEQGEDNQDQNNNTKQDKDKRTQRIRPSGRGRHREGRCLDHQCSRGRE